MRISKEQVLYIVTNIHAFFGKDAEVWLFGSRCDDQKKVEILISIFRHHKMILKSFHQR